MDEVCYSCHILVQVPEQVTARNVPIRAGTEKRSVANTGMWDMGPKE